MEFILAEGDATVCPTCEAAPLAPVQPRRRVLGWVLLGVIAVPILAVVLAESGAVSASKTDCKSAAEGWWVWESSSAGPRGRVGPLRGVAFAPTATVSDRGVGRDLANRVAAAIKKVAPGDRGAKLEINITRVTPEGTDWVPFRKAGSCTFATTYVLVAETPWSEFTARGGIEGEVTQTMTGLCSTEEYRDKMAAKIAEAILNDIASKIAKHS